MNLLKLFQFIALVSIFGSLLKAVPISYSGKVSINGINFDGEANFIFEILNPSESVLWKNGSTSKDSIKVTVRNGRYLVLLGGQGMNQLPAKLFLDNDEVYLKVSVDLKNGQGFQVLGPNQRITSNGYAKVAEFSKHALKADSISQGAIQNEHFSKDVLKYFKPKIKQHPVAAEIFENNDVSFSVDADGRFLNYQWVRNGIPIPGETSPRLNLKEADLSKNSSEYSVRISNDFGMIESTQARLTVNKTLKSWSKNLMDPNNLGGENFFRITDYVIDESGNIAMAVSESGLKADGNSTGFHMSFMKLDPNGNLITKNQLISSSLNFWEQNIKILNSNDGGFIIFARYSDSINDSLEYTNSQTLKILKLNSDGKKIWSKNYKANSVSDPIKIISISKGGYMLISQAGSSLNLTGGIRTTRNSGGIGSDYWVAKFDENGTKIWDKSFGGIGDDTPKDIAETSYGEFIISGISDSNKSIIKTVDTNNSNTWMVKFNSYGNKISDFKIDALASALTPLDSNKFVYLSQKYSPFNTSNEILINEFDLNSQAIVSTKSITPNAVKNGGFVLPANHNLWLTKSIKDEFLLSGLCLKIVNNSWQELVFVILLDDNYNIIWEKEITDSNNQRTFYHELSSKEGNDGSFVIVLSQNLSLPFTNSSRFAHTILKFDKDGNIDPSEHKALDFEIK